jgi:D-tyrosyl-tRNA(Tyr) deacylase
MRAVVQRVSEASVRVGEEIVGRIGRGVLVFLGVARDDGEREADYLVDKIVHLRIFEDDEGKLNRSVLEVGGEALVVSQFTLLGDCRKGRRPSFIEAAGPEHGNRLYERVVAGVRRAGVAVQTGRFRALMAVSLVNDGPVTLVVDTPRAG